MIDIEFLFKEINKFKLESPVYLWYQGNTYLVGYNKSGKYDHLASGKTSFEALARALDMLRHLYSENETVDTNGGVLYRP